MQIADPVFIERRGQLPLGEAGPARGRDRSRVDEQADAGALELAEHGIRRRLLVADGEERIHAFNRSISAMAAAGARTFPSWMK